MSARSKNNEEPLKPVRSRPQRVRPENTLEQLVDMAQVPCILCRRTFVPERLKVHKVGCQRMTDRRPAPYDDLVRRWRGTAVEPHVYKLNHLPPPPRLSKFDWQPKPSIYKKDQEGAHRSPTRPVPVMRSSNLTEEFDLLVPRSSDAAFSKDERATTKTSQK